MLWQCYSNFGRKYMLYIFKLFNILVIWSFWSFFYFFLHFSIQAKGNQNIDAAMHNYFHLFCVSGLPDLKTYFYLFFKKKSENAQEFRGVSTVNNCYFYFGLS